MKSKIQVKSIYGAVLFEYEAEDNSIKKTLIEAISKRADLRSANLRSANLRSADLSGADLRSADLSGANLSGADLSGADLSDANLRSADLSGADLRSADLSGANLSGADLSGADLSGANLRSAYLSGADLSGADLRSAKNSGYAIALTRICPEGDIIGWKKAYEVGTMKKVIIKLLIPKEAKRNNAFGRKCRAEFADVLEMDGATEAVSDHNREFKYEVSKRVTPDKFDEDFMNECSHGIHFFITRLEAENY